MRALLEVDAVSRRYGSLVALDRIGLRLGAGERHAVIGPNGAGKTTLLNLVAGAAHTSGGRIRFAGRDVTRLGPARRARLGIGRIHQRPAVWPSLSTLDNVTMAGARRCGGFRRALPAARALISTMELPDVTAAQLSHGQRRQLEIAMALAGRPRLLLLDEPAAGLSAVEFARLGAVLDDLPRTVTVLLVEHRLDLVYAFADRVTVLRDGRHVATGTPDEIRASSVVRSAYAEAVS